METEKGEQNYRILEMKELHGTSNLTSSFEQGGRKIQLPLWFPLLSLGGSNIKVNLAAAQ